MVRQGIALTIAGVVLAAPLAGCSGDTGPQAHTPVSIVDALESKPEFGLKCDEPEANGFGVICTPTGEGSFDRMSLVVVLISTLDFDRTTEFYRRQHESRCSTAQESYESVLDGTTKSYIPFERTARSYVVIGKNWATELISKQLDAQAVADVTGGLLVSGEEWCANPRPLVDFGK